MNREERLIREGEVLTSLINNPRVASASLEPQLYRLRVTQRYRAGGQELVKPFEKIGTLEAIEEYAYITLGSERNGQTDTQAEGT